MSKISLVLLAIIILCKQSCGVPNSVVVETIIVETTTEKEDDFTDLPDEDVDEALNHDLGRYTTMLFRYNNKQLEKYQDSDKCTDDFIKCIINQGVATPVCAYHTPYEENEGFFTYNSYCDVYFENCKRGIRFWRILDTGRCHPKLPYYLFREIKET